MKKERIYFPIITKLGIISLIGAMASAMISTIWAIYLDSFVGSAAIVGLVSGFLALVSFISYFIFIPFIEKSNKSKIYSRTILLFGILYILFAINKNFFIFILLASIMNLIFTFRLTSFGIIIKDKSNKRKLSQNEGLMFTFSNTAWVIGPLIAGFLGDRLGISSVFFLGAIFCFLSYFLFKISKIRDAHIIKNPDKNIVKNFIEFFKYKPRVISYIMSAGISFWWSLIYIFIPVYMVEHGMTEIIVAYFLFAIPIPLILLEFKFGSMASKHGFRKMFGLGFLIVAIISFICFFLISFSFYWILALLVLGSVGMAMLEPISESYFFDISKERDGQRFYGPHKTSIDSGQFFAKVISSLLLFILPFEYLFLFFGIVMFGLFILSFKVRNIVEQTFSKKGFQKKRK